MTCCAVFLDDPCTLDYNDFLKQAISLLGLGMTCVEIIVGTRFEGSKLLSSVLTEIYSTVRRFATQSKDPYSLTINVLFDLDKNRLEALAQKWVVIVKPQIETLPFSPSCVVFEILGVPETRDSRQYSSNILEGNCFSDSKGNGFNVVAVGGTFDYLHDGHKILLSVAAWVTKQELIIGVTGSELVQNKQYSDLIQPLSQRIRSVMDFVAMILPNKMFQIYEINDVYGPTGYISSIDALVVSHESSKGGQYVNKYRIEKGFCRLEIICIEVVGNITASEDNNWDGKLSSTLIRKLKS